MRKAMYVLGMVLSFSMIFTFGCEKAQQSDVSATEEQKDTVAEEQQEVQVPAQSQVSLGTIVVNGKEFSVEIASTDEQKARGLMGRESLPENSGMWFVFTSPVQEKFWMQGMEIPLDMIFVDENMKAVHIVENAVPGSTELISSPTPYMYVLEVNAGTAAKNPIKVGDTLEKRIGSQ